MMVERTHWTERLAHIGTGISGVVALIAIVITQIQLRAKDDQFEALLNSYEPLLASVAETSNANDALYDLMPLLSGEAALSASQIWGSPEWQNTGLPKRHLVGVLRFGVAQNILHVFPDQQNSARPFPELFRWNPLYRISD